MIIKAGTVEQAMQIFGEIPKDIFQKTVEICASLDKNYGVNRNIDEDDGGYVIIVTDKTDLKDLSSEYDIDLKNDIFEFAEIISSVPEYVNILYLRNNDYIVTVLIPSAITPKNILDEAD